MSTISAQARRELIKAIQDRYLASSMSERRRILDGFVALTGYHRKHAIRVLRAPLPAPDTRPPRPRVYDEAVRDALVVLWETSDRSCGKRLKPLLPILVLALERDGRLSLEASVRSRLLAVSAATIDRLLAAHRASAPPRRRKQPPRPRTPSQPLAARAADDAQAAAPRAARAADDAPQAAAPRAARAADDDAQAATHAAISDQPARSPTAPAGAAPTPPRHWRTRTDPFEGAWPHVVAWLEVEPRQTAKRLLQRLRDEGLGEFPARHVRTLQRRIKAWRHALLPARHQGDPGNIPE